MANLPLPAKVSASLAKLNPCVITSPRSDGQPVSVATWYLWEGGRALVNMDEGRKRLDYLRADPRVSPSILQAENRYIHVSLQGSAGGADGRSRSGRYRAYFHALQRPARVTAAG
nr:MULTISPECIES: pyridoxamine 5'-phosphate oxidase family protein [unclassified Frankia]